MSLPNSMTGIVIVTHGVHGEEMLKEAQVIVGELPQVRVVTALGTDPMSSTRTKVLAASTDVDTGNGVLFLVDLHGSTPANVCVSVMEKGPRPAAELLSGLNMAMLLKLATSDRSQGPRALAELLRETGRRSIRMGSEWTNHLPLGGAD